MTDAGLRKVLNVVYGIQFWNNHSLIKILDAQHRLGSTTMFLILI